MHAPRSHSRPVCRPPPYVDEFAGSDADPALRRPILSLAYVFAGLLALHGLVWGAGSWLLQRQTASLLATASQHGWSVTTQDRTIGGWPLAAALTIERPAIEGGERSIPGGLAWSADRLVARIPLLHPLTLVLSPEGQQFLRLSHAPDIGFTASRAEARLGLWTGSQGWAEFEADGVAGGIAGSRHPQDVLVAMLRVEIRQAPPVPARDGAAVSSITVDTRAHDIDLPDIGRWPLGATISDAGAELTLLAVPLTLSDRALSAGSESGAAQAASWRDGGGRVQIGRAQLRWGPLRLEGSAELGLDADLQPAGSGTVFVAGIGPALDAATGGGVVAPGVALTAKAVLGLMPQADGGAVRLPFRLHDRTVSVGEIPMARLGRIAW